MILNNSSIIRVCDFSFQILCPELNKVANARTITLTLINRTRKNQIS